WHPARRGPRPPGDGYTAAALCGLRTAESHTAISGSPLGIPMRTGNAPAQKKVAAECKKFWLEKFWPEQASTACNAGPDQTVSVSNPLTVIEHGSRVKRPQMWASHVLEVTAHAAVRGGHFGTLVGHAHFHHLVRGRKHVDIRRTAERHRLDAVPDD